MMNLLLKKIFFTMKENGNDSRWSLFFYRNISTTYAYFFEWNKNKLFIFVWKKSKKRKTIFCASKNYLKKKPFASKIFIKKRFFAVLPSQKIENNFTLTTTLFFLLKLPFEIFVFRKKKSLKIKNMYVKKLNIFILKCLLRNDCF